MVVLTKGSLDHIEVEDPLKKRSKLDPQMVKALKLFAKNHKQLEKATDPHKGIH